LNVFEKIKNKKNGIRKAKIAEKKETTFSPPTTVSVKSDDTIPPVNMKMNEKFNKKSFISLFLGNLPSMKIFVNPTNMKKITERVMGWNLILEISK